MSYVCGGGSEAGTEAPETAEEEIPCQKMHHYIRVPVHSPHHGEQPGNHRVLRSCHPPGQARLHLSTWLTMSLNACSGEAGLKESNGHPVGLCSGLHTLNLFYSSR